MKLSGIGFSNYRSMGQETVWLNLEKKVNLLIGQNNSGKSNVIRALSAAAKSKPGRRFAIPRIEELDRHRRGQQNWLGVAAKVRIEDTEKHLGSPGAEEEFVLGFADDPSKPQCINTPFAAMDMSRLNRLLKAEFEDGGYGPGPWPADEFVRRKKEIGMMLASRVLGDQLPEVHLIPQFREITPNGSDLLRGNGLVEQIARWRDPAIGKDGDRKRFEDIQGLLRRLLGMPSIQLAVSPEDKRLLVESDHLRLPLDSYGTGVHELIILAAAIHSQEKVIFCIEEPEIHLHPLLQKELLKFLLEKTDNRYVISTHSSAFMQPSDDLHIVHLWLEDGATRSRQVETTGHALDVLGDLGVRASDLLQSNYVIWVEGPSDRIYLNRWLTLLDPQLQEGLHYSVMFYGGRLLSHLSLEREDWPSPGDLICLLRINQRSMVIIDSDMASEFGPVNATKHRVAEECERNGVFSWITEGREIENYLPATAVSAAYVGITGLPKHDVQLGRFDDLDEVLSTAFGGEWQEKWSYGKAKPIRAREIAEHIKREDIDGEHAAKLARVVEEIRRANGL